MENTELPTKDATSEEESNLILDVSTNLKMIIMELE